MTVRAPVQAHAPLCDTLSALLLRARGDGESAPRAVLAMEHMEPMEQACSLVITPTLAMEHMEPMAPLERPGGEAEGVLKRSLRMKPLSVGMILPD